jgi:ComF family protein
VKVAIAGLIDIVFPPRCISCEAVIYGEDDHCFCPDCFAGIDFIRSPLCTHCGMPFTGDHQTDHLCGDCLSSKPFFTVARSVGQYQGILLNCIHKFKYQEKIAVGEVLGKLMAVFVYPAINISEYSLIMPVPLHRKRLRERGFNQSLILAKEIAKEFSLPLDFMTLKRRIYAGPQVGLGRTERQSNVKNAFAVKDSNRVRGERIILVDDVYTTGSTGNECARVLMNCEAREVAIITLARAV